MFVQMIVLPSFPLSNIIALSIWFYQNKGSISDNEHCRGA